MRKLRINEERRQDLSSRPKPAESLASMASLYTFFVNFSSNHKLREKQVIIKCTKKTVLVFIVRSLTSVLLPICTNLSRISHHSRDGVDEEENFLIMLVDRD